MSNSNVKFIRVKGRIVPIKQDRLKKQAAAGAASGAAQGIGMRFLAAGKRKSGLALFGASVATNLVSDFFSIRDASKVTKKAGLKEGLKEYGKQFLARTGGQVAGGLAAPYLLKGAAQTLKAGADFKKAQAFKKSTGIKDVYPSFKSKGNLLTHRKK